MKNNPKQGLIGKQTLTDAEITEIEQLAHLCNNYENLHMRIGWLKLRPQLSGVTNDFLYYADGTLVGYLVLDGYGGSEVEVTGMVHPDHRRQGIFSALLSAAREECKRGGAQKLVFICEHSSPSGQAFIAHIGAQHVFSEYAMVLETFREKKSFDDHLYFREARARDLEALVTIVADDAGGAVEQARTTVSRYFQEPRCRVYLATFGQPPLGCNEPIGCLRLYDMDDEVGIYGFIVRPDYRGFGYGRQMLEETIHLVKDHSQKRITLEVDTENANALGLYRSCGFKEVTAYGYYNLDII